MNPDAPWSPKNPGGDLTPLLTAAIEAARVRHPSGKVSGMNATPVVLTAKDRCDVQCPAQAVYRMHKDDAVTGVGAVLDMCAHHWRQNAPTMFDQGWVVVAGNPDMFLTPHAPDPEGTPS